MQYDFEQHGLPKRINTTFKEVYELWFTQYKQTVKESTWVKTQEMFNNHALPAYGKLKIDKIDIKYCQKIINQWFAYTKTKFLVMHNYVAKVFDFAIAMEIIFDNPARKVTVPKVMAEIIEEEEFNYYSKEQLIEFLTYLKQDGTNKAYTLFHLLAFTGVRQGEALALTWADISYTHKTLTISKTLTRGERSRLIVLPPKTKRSARTISIDDGTIAVLKKWHKTQKTEALKNGFNTLGPQQLIFTDTKNQLLSPTRSRKWLISVQENHGLKKITVHGFRHTHCSLLFEADATIQEVQERLGHDDVKTTMNIYTHVTKKTKSGTAQKFANYINLN